MTVHKKHLGAMAFLRRHKQGREILQEVEAHAIAEELTIRKGVIRVEFRSPRQNSYVHVVNQTWKGE